MYKTDEELVARSAAGDVDSFNQLVVRWKRPIYSLAYRVLGREEDARDVSQETFLRAFRAVKGFKGQAKFSSWLYRIAPRDSSGEPAEPAIGGRCARFCGGGAACG